MVIVVGHSLINVKSPLSSTSPHLDELDHNVHLLDSLDKEDGLIRSLLCRIPFARGISIRNQAPFEHLHDPKGLRYSVDTLSCKSHGTTRAPTQGRVPRPGHICIPSIGRSPIFLASYCHHFHAMRCPKGRFTAVFEETNPLHQIGLRQPFLADPKRSLGHRLRIVVDIMCSLRYTFTMLWKYILPRDAPLSLRGET